MSERWQLGAVELAGKIRSGEVSSREVVEAHLARIDAVAPIDAPSVERMRAAGAIPFARTNLPDLGVEVPVPIDPVTV